MLDGYEDAAAAAAEYWLLEPQPEEEDSISILGQKVSSHVLRKSNSSKYCPSEGTCAPVDRTGDAASGVDSAEPLL